jgi:hypothetical protein
MLMPSASADSDGELDVIFAGHESEADWSGR